MNKDSIKAMRKARDAGPTDILQRQPATSQRDSAAFSLPQLRGRVDEVDESAHLAVLVISPDAAGEDDRIIPDDASGYFRGMALQSPGGMKIGTITTSKVDNEGDIVLTADIDNSGILEDLLSGAFNGVAVTAQSVSCTRMGASWVHRIRPLVVRLVAPVSGVNGDMNVSKTFFVRKKDGSLMKRAFVEGRGHMGTGVGSEIGNQLDVFKKIHKGGGLPLDSDQLMKISHPRTSERAEYIPMEKSHKDMQKIHRGGRRDELAKRR